MVTVNLLTAIERMTQTINAVGSHDFAAVTQHIVDIVLDEVDCIGGLLMIANRKENRVYSVVYSAVRQRPDGNGVGLYLSKHIIEQHGGSIAVKSKVGTGTTFTVTLPRHQS